MVASPRAWSLKLASILKVEMFQQSKDVAVTYGYMRYNRSVKVADCKTSYADSAYLLVNEAETGHN
jgi:hypothetical protein